MIEFFSKVLDYPYPYEKYTQVAVRHFIFGGMENTSATTQTDGTLHDRRAAIDFTSDELVSHELAHQWFGDLLTCKTWAHAWLNEGFATYFEALWKEEDLGREEFDYEMLLNAGLVHGRAVQKGDRLQPLRVSAGPLRHAPLSEGRVGLAHAAPQAR